MLGGVRTAVSRQFDEFERCLCARGAGVSSEQKGETFSWEWSGFDHFSEVLRIRGNGFGGERHH